VRRGCFVSTQTNRVVARIALRTPTGDGFGAADVQIDGGAVWVVGDTGVLRIDSRHNAAGRFVPVTDARGEAPHGTAVAAGSAWAFMLDGRILRFDASSGRTAGTLRVRRPPGSGLFRGHPGTLTMIGTKQVAALDPESAQLLWQTTLEGDARWWTAADGGLWMYVARQPLARDRLVGLGARSGRRLSRVQLPESNVTGMATVGRDDWIATSTGKLVVVRR
jgi:sugar lactone lactonase YvrE